MKRERGKLGGSAHMEFLGPKDKVLWQPIIGQRVKVVRANSDFEKKSFG